MTTPHHESSGGGREPLAARLGRSLFVAGLIGPLLTLVYQGAGLLAGQGLVIWQTALTFAVPFCIAMALPKLVGHAQQPGPAMETPAAPEARPGRMDEGHAVARARPDLRAAPDDVLHRLDEATRIVGQIRDNATGVEQATLARSLFIEERAEESRAAGETVGELSQALGAAVAVAERTAFNAAEQVQQFQVLVERLDRLKQDGLPVIPGSPTSIESAGGASGRIAAVRGRLGKH